MYYAGVLNILDVFDKLMIIDPLIKLINCVYVIFVNMINHFRKIIFSTYDFIYESLSDQSPPIQMHGIYCIKTNELVSRLRQIATNRLMTHCAYETFIDNIPLSSNYLVDIKIIRKTMIGSVCKVLKYHNKSMIPIRKHIELYDLTDECEIGLSKQQIDRLWELEHWEIYH